MKSRALLKRRTDQLNPYVPTDPEKPSAPGTPIVSNITTAGTATVTVPAATDNVGVAGYAAYIDNSGEAIDNSVTTTLNLTGLSAGEHSVVVRAFDAANNFSDASASVLFAVDSGFASIFEKFDKSSESSSMFDGGAIRVVRNSIPPSKFSLDLWNDTIIQNATLVYDAPDPDAKSATWTSTASSARGCLAIGIDVEAGKQYYGRCKVSNLVGAPGSIIWTDSGVGTTSATLTEDGVVGIVWTADVTEQANFRVGLNPAGPVGVAGVSVTISDVSWGELPVGESAPPEFVPIATSGSFGYPNNNTLVAGVVTDSGGTVNEFASSRNLLVMGDSFSNNSLDFAQLLMKSYSDIGVIIHGIPGGRSADNIDLVSDALNLIGLRWVPEGSQPTDVTGFNQNMDRPAVLFYQFIVNDIIGHSSSPVTLELLQSYISTVRSICSEHGVYLIVSDCPPFAGYSVATDDELLIREQYNSWISSLSNNKIFKVLRSSKILGSSTVFTRYPYDTLRAEFDVGDFLHPNEAGSQALADKLYQLATGD